MNRKSFHLRWNNHLQNLQSLFENLFNEQSLVDVTISCSDGTLYGHKLVLSACSPYFEQVFKDNPCKHPIMILKGIRRQDMQVLLEYMYTGSVDVGEDDLEILLDIATELRIKGLVQRTDESFQSSCQSSKQDKANNSSTKDSRNNVSSTSPNSQPMDDLSWQAELVAKSPPSKHKENSLHNNQANNSVIEDFTNNSHMMENQEENQDFGHLYPEHDMKEGTISVKREYQENSEEETNGLSLLDSLDESSENMQVNYSYSDSKPPESDEVNFLCHVCNRTFQNKGSYQRHMLTHAGVKPHHCTFCNQSFLRLSHLQRHIRVHTGERPYVCGQCPKQFARSDKLRQHYIIQHNGPNCTSRGGKPRGRPRKNHDFYPPSTMVSSMNNGYPSIDLNPASTSATVSSLHSTYPAVSVSTVLSMNAV